jgi:hypothetical protein
LHIGFQKSGSITEASFSDIKKLSLAKLKLNDEIPDGIDKQHKEVGKALSSNTIHALNPRFQGSTDHESIAFYAGSTG